MWVVTSVQYNLVNRSTVISCFSPMFKNTFFCCENQWSKQSFCNWLRDQGPIISLIKFGSRSEVSEPGGIQETTPWRSSKPFVISQHDMIFIVHLQVKQWPSSGLGDSNIFLTIKQPSLVAVVYAWGKSIHNTPITHFQWKLHIQSQTVPSPPLGISSPASAF